MIYIINNRAKTDVEIRTRDVLYIFPVGESERTLPDIVVADINNLNLNFIDFKQKVFEMIEDDEPVITSNIKVVVPETIVEPVIVDTVVVPTIQEVVKEVETVKVEEKAKPKYPLTPKKK